MPLSRRQALTGSAALLITASAAPFAVRAAVSPAVAALDGSQLIYLTPVLGDGSESTCHGEVWFFEDQGDAVIFTARDRWKATAVRDGLDEARIWVGDVGPVGRSGGRFRQEPSFKAFASLDTSSETFSRLMAAFAKRYPDEWGKWGPRFQKGWDQGTRVMIRYQPIAS